MRTFAAAVLATVAEHPHTLRGETETLGLKFLLFYTLPGRLATDCGSGVCAPLGDGAAAVPNFPHHTASLFEAD